MAQGKKSFVLYSDMLQSIEHLTNEEKGMLLTHLLEYVNDLNPVLTDRLILTAWKPIELSLKRDLVKFEEVKAKRSDAGKRSAELRALKTEEQISTNPTSVESVKQTSTNPTVNDSDNVNVNDSVSDNDILLKKETKNDLIFNELLISEMWLENTAMQSKAKFKTSEVKVFLKKYNDMLNVQFEIKNNKTEYCTHFINWLNKQERPQPPADHYYNKDGILTRRYS